VLQLPVILTEQYPQGLGNTCSAVRDAIGDESAKAVEKLRFTACVDEVLRRLSSLKRDAVVVVGIEAHVCLQQTVLDLLRSGYQPYVCVDAITSRRELDRSTAIERMRDSGAIITTTESVIFEMLDRAGTEQFKQILKIVK
jgi:nicotinamidase-related amidase